MMLMPDGSLQASGPWACVGKTLRASNLEPVDQFRSPSMHSSGRAHCHAACGCAVALKSAVDACVRGCAGSMHGLRFVAAAFDRLGVAPPMQARYEVRMQQSMLSSFGVF